LQEQKSAVAEQLITDMLAQRIEELTTIFTDQRKRKGGSNQFAIRNSQLAIKKRGLAKILEFTSISLF